MTDLTSDPLDRTTMNLARWLAEHHSRRSFMGLIGRLALAVSGASIIEALELTAPSKKAFADHCWPGYHAGSPCTYQTTCAANGWSPGQYWQSCCVGICGNCLSWKLVKFQDCCGGKGCSHKSTTVYCPVPTCFKCKIKSCTTTHCARTCDQAPAEAA